MPTRVDEHLAQPAVRVDLADGAGHHVQPLVGDDEAAAGEPGVGQGGAAG